MRLQPVAYMTWAKSHLEDPGLFNLGSSGIRDLLTMDDISPLMEGLSIWGHNEDGLPTLKEAIASRYRVPPGHLLVAEGASLANFLILSAWIRPGDPVLLEEPYYEPLGSNLAATGARVRLVPVDHDGGHRAILDILRAGRGPRWRAAVVTNPHNPSGTRLDEQLLDDLAEACGANGGLLIVDEAYREILFEDPPGCSAANRPYTVSTSSLTKVFGLSHLRIGWAVGPPEVIDHAIRIHDNLGVVHPYLTEAIGARVLGTPGLLDQWRSRVRERTQGNRALLDSFLDGVPAFTGNRPRGGILAFPRFTGIAGWPDADSLCERARKEARIVMVPGRFFRRPDHVRIAVGGPEEQVKESLGALARYLELRTADGADR